VFADQLLHQHIFWHARWDGFKIKINMSTTEFDLENVIAVTEASLKDEQKQAIAKAMEDYKQQYLKAFSINRSSEVIQKEALPMPRQVTFEANPGKLQDIVDSAINRALINQAGVLSNTVFNAVARNFKEGQLPPNYVGPSHHQPGSLVVTAPSAATAAVGTETVVPPCTLGVTNAQSTPMTTNPSTLDESIKHYYRSVGIGNVRTGPSS